jgi:hypothetical protein
MSCPLDSEFPPDQRVQFAARRIGARHDECAYALRLFHRRVFARDFDVACLVVGHLAHVPVDVRQGLLCPALGGQLDCRFQIRSSLALDLIDDSCPHAVRLQLRKRPPRFHRLQLLDIPGEGNPRAVPLRDPQRCLHLTRRHEPRLVDDDQVRLSMFLSLDARKVASVEAFNPSD